MLDADTTRESDLAMSERPPSVGAVETELAAFVAASADCTSRERFRDLALTRLAAILGVSVGFFLSLDRGPSVPSVLPWDPALADQLSRQRTRYLAELAPIAQAARGAGGVVVDTAVLTAPARRRLGFYAELVGPRGLGELLFAYVGLRGVQSAVIALGRPAGAPGFGLAERAALVRLLPAIKLGDHAHTRTRAPRATGWARGSREGAFVAACGQLTEREQEIVGYVAVGLRNDEIALACGSSVNTVRNQLRSIFRKVGVASRTELTHAAISSGMVR
jgi:DNA-binding CsgD family transcriptional regulator